MASARQCTKTRTSRISDDLVVDTDCALGLCWHWSRGSWRTPPSSSQIPMAGHSEARRAAGLHTANTRSLSPTTEPKFSPCRSRRSREAAATRAPLLQELHRESSVRRKVADVSRQCGSNSPTPTYRRSSRCRRRVADQRSRGSLPGVLAHYEAVGRPLSCRRVHARSII